MWFFRHLTYVKDYFSIITVKAFYNQTFAVLHPISKCNDPQNPRLILALL